MLSGSNSSFLWGKITKTSWLGLAMSAAGIGMFMLA